MRRLVICLVLALVFPGRSYAQPAPPVPESPTAADPMVPAPTVPPLPPVAPPPSDEPLRPIELDVGHCDATQVELADQGIPTTWRDYEIEGELLESKDTVRALLDPTLQNSHALTASTRNDIRRAAKAFGYYVLGLSTTSTAAGVKLSVHVEPLPLIRKVDVNVEQTWFGIRFDDEIRRRMRLRVGGYLPWTPEARTCEIVTEQKRLEEYLAEEGYFDANVFIKQDIDHHAVKLSVKVELGTVYTIDPRRIKVAKQPGPIAPVFTDDELRAVFVHRGNCLVWGTICIDGPRFTTAYHKADLKKIVENYQKRGFPAVRVTDDFDAATKTNYDRRSHTVSFTLTIDPRRQLDIQFEGNDTGSAPDEELRQQLTFNQAGSSDDVEAAESARAITAYLQTKGFFDARVTWNRERFPELDRVVYRIDQGGTRRVLEIQFVGNHAVASSKLNDAIATRKVTLQTTLFGTTTSATSPQLAADADRIVAVYTALGFRDAHVRVSASTDPATLASTALAAAMLSSGRGDGELYVRFAIEEGEPTLLTQVRIELGTGGDALVTPDDRALCATALKDLGDVVGDRRFASQAVANRCIAIVPQFNYRADDIDSAKDRLRELLWNDGRPRAKVELVAHPLGPHRVEAVYKLTSTERLKIGKLVIRGNFRTRDTIFWRELQLGEGQPLTADALAEAASRLRSTGLFDAVNIDMPDLERTSAGEVHAVVRVQERYDYHLLVDVEGGYSSYSGVFVKLAPSLKNLFGLGISLDTSGTIGADFTALLASALSLRQLNLEATLRIPNYLLHHVAQLELTAFHRLNDTPRFGPVTTEGLTLAGAHNWPRIRTVAHVARSLTLGVHYDFRLRERQVDVLRPIGADDDQTQVPISTLTGSIGVTFEWEQRTDRRGNLSPLAPEAGFRLEGTVSYASPVLFGQDQFLKVSAAGSKYWPLTDNLVLRGDLRYDQGFPFGGAVLLPEVERFFAGGDSTVRGYNDEKLATEIISVGIPPLDNVQQIRVLSAGGNIRAMGSLDAQLRIYKVLATALFFDAGLITNEWATVSPAALRPSVGMALLRVVTPFGALAFERAIPLRPELGDDPRGRWHISFAARAQF